MYGMPTRVRNLYVGLRESNSHGGGAQSTNGQQWIAILIWLCLSTRLGRFLLKIRRNIELSDLREI